MPRCESIESVGRAAFRDLDAVLALTAPAPETAPNRDIANITTLVETMRRAGMDVSMTIEGDRGELPNIVEWSAYRIVQEALTNVAKHAPRAGVRVAIRFEPTRGRGVRRGRRRSASASRRPDGRAGV